jgi:hypothetical protein
MECGKISRVTYQSYALFASAVLSVGLSLSPVLGQEGPPPGPPSGAPGGAEGGRAPNGFRRQPPGPPPGPTPRLPDIPYLGVNAGKPDFGGLAKGMWQVPYIIDMQKQGKAPDGGPVIVPFTPLGKKEFDERTANHSKDDPEGFCLPPGVPRMMYTPYPTEIFQLPDRILFIYEGGAHVWRVIWMDGRKQPVDPNPDYLGYSVGHWEGDTLVVDTIGMNDRTWLDAAGHGHGEKLHVTEKFTRPDSNTLRLEATMEDPDYYTKPWTVVTTARWASGQELMEYICQENNKDLQHLVGK